MARIRTIKPEFFRHEELFEAELSSGLPLRVAFAGLFTVADREGRFKWQPRVIKLDVLPFDDVNFAEVLEVLTGHGFIIKYQVGTDTYGHIPSWQKHQHINQREAESTIPAPDSDGARTCIDIPARGEGKGREQEEEGNTLSLRSSDARTRKLDLEREFSETFWPAYPHKVQRTAAIRAWPRARDKADLEQIMAGLQRYIRDKPPDQHWRNPATFLNGESWNDQPARPPIPNGKPTAHATIRGAIARAVERRSGVDIGQAGADDRLPFDRDGSTEVGIVAGELAAPALPERH